MKRLALLLVGIVFLVLIPFAAPSQASPVAQQEPEPIIHCSDLRIDTTQVRVTCTAAGIMLLSTVIDLPVVQLPPVTLPPLPRATITLRPPAVTATVRLPGDTETVRVPGSTVTDFITRPGETKTIIRPGETKTVKPRPEVVTQSALPQPTQTVTVDAEGSRQPDTNGGTIDPGNDTVLTFPKITLSTPEATVLGIGAITLLMILIILGMWAGYYLGYKDSDKAEAKFLSSLLRK